MYRGVIFDLDGALIDSHSYTVFAVRLACHPFGVFPTDKEIEDAFEADEHIILSKLVGPRLADKAYARLLENYRENVHRLDLHPEIIRLLDNCMRAQIRLGLFTGRSSNSMEPILDELGLRDFFRVIVSSEGHGEPKPTSQVVRSLLKQLGTAPHQSLLIGDSITDVEAATESGMDALRATWYYKHDAPQDDKAVVCNDPADLWKHIGLTGDH